MDIYDKTGQPISKERWYELKHDKSYWVIKQTEIGNFWVSTVWLGLDHNFGMGAPLIFETMVFLRSRNKKEWLLGDPLETDRHSTEEEALWVHDAHVQKYEKIAQHQENKKRRKKPKEPKLPTAPKGRFVDISEDE